MKKGIVAAVVAAVALGMYGLYAAHVRKIQRSVQGDPVRTVNAFMGTAAKLSTLMWDEEERENVRRALKQWEESSEQKDAVEAAELLKQYGIQSPAPLFHEEKYARAAIGILCFFRFDSFALTDKNVQEDKAVVTAEFVPEDVLGLKSLVSKMGAPVPETRKKPVSVSFHLERRGHRWYIIEIGGELSQLIEAARKLRALR